MKNSDLWKQYEDYTKDLSTIARQLGFAASAISWFFKNTDNVFPKEILIALKFIIAFFIADIVQYLFAAIFLRFWTRSQEKAKWKENGNIEGEYLKPQWLDYPAFTFWWIKIFCLIIVYVFIGVYIFRI